MCSPRIEGKQNRGSSEQKRVVYVFYIKAIYLSDFYAYSEIGRQYFQGCYITAADETTEALDHPTMTLNVES